MRKLYIWINNRLTRLRKRKVTASRLLLLVPHCLQQSDCSQRLSPPMEECNRCGQCNVTELLKLRDRYGVQCCMARGGREALNYVREKNIDAVVAVACEKELVDGIRASFPKPVLAVTNRRLNGPCKDTCVDIPAVEEALKSILSEPAPHRAVKPTRATRGAPLSAPACDSCERAV